MMKRLSILILCFLALTNRSSGNLSLVSTEQAKQKQQALDAVWISIRNSRPTTNDYSVFYFDLQRDGSLLILRQRAPFGSSEDSQIQYAILPQSTARRIFQVISAPEVLNARDAELGEPIFSESDWVNVGATIGSKFKQAPLWGFTEELKDYPTQFQQVIEELKRFANKLPPTGSVKKLISAAFVDDRRAKAIRDDPRRSYNIIDLAEKDLAEIPALNQARTYLQRMFPVKSDGELQRLHSLMKASNLKGTGEGFFQTSSGQTYQIRFY